jgi:hypothetical protein
MDTIKQLSFFTIDLMKSAINHDENLSGKAIEILLQKLYFPTQDICNYTITQSFTG